MTSTYERYCELAAMAKLDQSLLSNHLDSKAPEWIARQTAERVEMREASVVFSEWLVSQGGYEAEHASNEAFIARLDAEISAGNEAMSVYKNYGWASAQ